MPVQRLEQTTIPCPQFEWRYSCLHRSPLSQIQVCLLALPFPDLLRLPIFDRLARDSEPFNSRWHTAVTRCLQDNFSYLFFRTAVVQRSFNVSRKLGASVLAA